MIIAICFHGFLPVSGNSDLLPCPFVIYADFEAILPSPEEEEGVAESYRGGKVLSTHRVSSWAYSIHCLYPEHGRRLGVHGVPLEVPRDWVAQPGDGRKRDITDTTHAASKLFRCLAEDVEVMCKIVEEECNKELVMREGEQERYESETECHICRRPLSEKRRGDKVRDHDHFTGRYRGAAHSKCNLDYRYNTTRSSYKVPVFFHNLTGYDSVHLMTALTDNVASMKKMKVIAKGFEKFTSLWVDRTRFCDSLQFLKGSLSELGSNLRKSFTGPNSKVSPPEKRADLYKAFAPVLAGMRLRYPIAMDSALEDKENSVFLDPEMEDILFGKGIYPYRYMDSLDKMSELSLPDIEWFDSDLGQKKKCKPAKYRKAERVWERFGFENLGEYTAFYCLLDVLVLRTVFTLFRETCMSRDAYGLDPAHYITAPSLAWSAMLLMNYRKPEGPLRIENITDPAMFTMVEAGIRGGMCQVMNPIAQANIPEMGEDFDESQPEKRILYWDVTNLYGWAMSQYLPIGEYRWEKGGGTMYTREPIDDEAEL